MSAREITVTLTATQIDDLLTLIQLNKIEGSYYGNKNQYWKRMDRTAAALLNAARMMSQLQ